MAGKTIHMGLSVRGVICRTNAELKRDYCKWITRKDGSTMTPDQLRDTFMDLLAEGKEVIPIGKCDNWDFKEGCKGHPSGESV
jgi:hypothetical protein